MLKVDCCAAERAKSLLPFPSKTTLFLVAFKLEGAESADLKNFKGGVECEVYGFCC